MDRTTTSPLSGTTLYLHTNLSGSGIMSDLSADPTTPAYYYNDSSSGALTSGQAAAVTGYVAVENLLLDSVGVARGDYVL